MSAQHPKHHKPVAKGAFGGVTRETRLVKALIRKLKEPRVVRREAQ